MPADCVPGLFLFSQTGEVFTVRAPRDGEEWMALNPQQDQQRWAALNAQLAVSSSSPVYQDRTNLEQLESLVQPTQFLEHLRKTMPMSEAQLDMVSTMLETMTQCLNALEVLFKGRQKAVDEFMSSTMTGIEKLKSSAISKAKRSSDNSNGPPRKQGRRGGGGGRGGGGLLTSGGGPQTGGGNQGGRQNFGGGQNFNGPPRPPGIQCGKCKRFGHKTDNCQG
jgi:hypothetical protein